MLEMVKQAAALPALTRHAWSYFRWAGPEGCLGPSLGVYVTSPRSLAWTLLQLPMPLPERPSTW